MDKQLPKRGFQPGAIQRLARGEQYRLIPVMRRGKLLLKEPALNGCERNLAGDKALLGVNVLGCAGNGGQPGDGRVFKQLAGRQTQTGLVGASDHLNTQDRVAAEFKEIVACANLLEVEQLRPDGGQRFFLWRAWRDIVSLRRSPVGGGQGFTIHFAIGRERQGIQHHKRGRDHVVGQFALQESA